MDAEEGEGYFVLLPKKGVVMGKSHSMQSARERLRGSVPDEGEEAHCTSAVNHASRSSEVQDTSRLAMVSVCLKGEMRFVVALYACWNNIPT